jgi:hypothetical protein
MNSATVRPVVTALITRYARSGCIPLLLFVCLAALPLLRPAYADTAVTINNFSFEDNVLAHGSFTNNVLTDWTVVALSSELVGAYNPNTFTQPIPDGLNTAYVNPGGKFFQDVGPLVANSTYNFSVFVGQRNDIPLPTYSIQLLDASTSTVLASGIPSAPGSGDFAKFNMTFDSAGFSSSVGDAIRIEFSASGTNSLSQVNFDAVTLGFSADSTAPVPEPRLFGLTLLGFGAIALLRLRRSTAR